MNATLRLAMTALCCLGAQAWAAQNLSVSFVHPENYTDASYSRLYGGERDRQSVQQAIEQHLHQLAERHLPPDRTLRIEVLDIDLAGHFEPWRHRAADVRILRDITWPSMRLRYTLSENDQVLASTEERLADMHYLGSYNTYASNDRLRYEKAMLDRWFEKLAAPKR